MKTTVIGTGAYGLALATILNENNNNVWMWTKFIEEKKELEKTKKTNKLKGFILDPNIKISNDLKEAVKGAKLIVIAVPTAFVDSVSKDLAKIITKDQHICIASKGIENNTCRFLYDVVKENTKNNNIAVISGPSFAIDVINKVPIGLALGCKKKKTADIIIKCFKNDHFKLRPTTDIIGIEICGSIKNIIAIASGIIEGMDLPISTKAFLLTESLHDIRELICALGGKKKTILSYAGFGDILLTCTSEKSRNYSFGILIGKGIDKDNLDEYLNNNTVEGIYTLKSIYQLIKRKKIKIPLINLIYNIVFKGENKEKLLTFLIKK